MEFESPFIISSCRYNNYDRAVINTVSQDVVQRWYRAHRELTSALRDPENELWVKLTPGKVHLHFHCFYQPRNMDTDSS